MPKHATAWHSAHLQPINIALLEKINEYWQRNSSRSACAPTTLHIWNLDNSHSALVVAKDLWLIERPNGVNMTDRIMSTSQIQNESHIQLLSENVERISMKPIMDISVSETLSVSVHNKLSLLPEYEHAEYIYKTSDLGEMKGSKYADHRNKISRYRRTYPHSQLIIDNLPPSARLLKDIDHLYEVWREYGASNSRLDTLIEREALRRYIKIDQPHNRPSFLVGSRYYYLRVDGQLVGFANIEIISSNYAIGHFLKINLNLSGIGEFLISSIAKELSDEGIEFLNTEEDMGIVGLRKFKEHLRPYKKLMAYSLASG